MWKYGKLPSKEELQNIMEYIESLLESNGAKRTNLCAINRRKFKYRDIYEYSGEFYRVGFIAFDEKPFIIIEWTNDKSLADEGIMEDLDPFPYDLSEEDLKKELYLATQAKTKGEK